jgi:hypothetical protein
MLQAEVCCLCLVSAMELYELTKRTPSLHLLYKTVGKSCLVVSTFVSVCIGIIGCQYANMLRYPTTASVSSSVILTCNSVYTQFTAKCMLKAILN